MFISGILTDGFPFQLHVWNLRNYVLLKWIHPALFCCESVKISRYLYFIQLFHFVYTERCYETYLYPYQYVATAGEATHKYCSSLWIWSKSLLPNPFIRVNSFLNLSTIEVPKESNHSIPGKEWKLLILCYESYLQLVESIFRWGFICWSSGVSSNYAWVCCSAVLWLHSMVGGTAYQYSCGISLHAACPVYPGAIWEEASRWWVLLHADKNLHTRMTTELPLFCDEEGPPCKQTTRTSSVHLVTLSRDSMFVLALKQSGNVIGWKSHEKGVSVRFPHAAR